MCVVGMCGWVVDGTLRRQLESVYRQASEEPRGWRLDHSQAVRPSPCRVRQTDTWQRRHSTDRRATTLPSAWSSRYTPHTLPPAIGQTRHTDHDRRWRCPVRPATGSRTHLLLGGPLPHPPPPPLPPPPTTRDQDVTTDLTWRQPTPYTWKLVTGLTPTRSCSLRIHIWIDSCQGRNWLRNVLIHTDNQR